MHSLLGLSMFQASAVSCSQVLCRHIHEFLSKRKISDCQTHDWHKNSYLKQLLLSSYLQYYQKPSVEQWQRFWQT